MSYESKLLALAAAAAVASPASAGVPTTPIRHIVGCVVWFWRFARELVEGVSFPLTP